MVLALVQFHEGIPCFARVHSDVCFAVPICTGHFRRYFFPMNVVFSVGCCIYYAGHFLALLQFHEGVPCFARVHSDVRFAVPICTGHFRRYFFPMNVVFSVGCCIYYAGHFLALLQFHEGIPCFARVHSDVCFAVCVHGCGTRYHSLNYFGFRCHVGHPHRKPVLPSIRSSTR